MLYKKLWLNLWVFAVTTFAVVWIEMYYDSHHEKIYLVTTFAVVWIEMEISYTATKRTRRHHLRGGVD